MATIRRKLGLVGWRWKQRPGSWKLCAPRLVFLLAISGCVGEPAATVTIALSEFPERVTSMSISVRDLESEELATSATIAAPRTSVRLGVPAERPLRFLAIARTTKLGPAAIGMMPAFVGRAERTIALGREEELVSLTVHRAGVLTVQPQIEGLPERLRGYRIGDEAEVRLELDEDTEQGVSSYLILRTGRYDPSLVQREEESEVIPSRGIYVAPETETIAPLLIRPRSAPLLPLDAALLSIVAPDELLLETGEEATLPLSFTASTALGGATTAEGAALTLTIEATPTRLLAGPNRFTATSLPATIEDVRIQGQGRLLLRARAELPDGRVLSATRALNVRPADLTPGPARTLALSLRDPAALLEGTKLEAALIDENGLFASSQGGVLDLSASDPWAFFPAGPKSAISPRDRGRVERDLSRPSGPRGLPVAVRATVTSSVPELTLTSTIVLPLLEMR